MYPEDLRYTAEHEWVRREGGALLRFGITDFASESLGDVVFVQLPEAGDELSAGASCGEVESTKSVSDLYAPVNGIVVESNSELEASPDLVNSDAYGQGWMVLVECASEQAAEAAWEGLLNAEQYSAAVD